MKKKLSLLLALLMIAVTGAWADTVVLGTPDASVTTLSDANGIVTITDASGSTGIQAGSGSYKMTYDGTAYVPMKLSGNRNFTLSYKEGVTFPCKKLRWDLPDRGHHWKDWTPRQSPVPGSYCRGVQHNSTFAECYSCRTDFRTES